MNLNSTTRAISLKWIRYVPYIFDFDRQRDGFIVPSSLEPDALLPVELELGIMIILVYRPIDPQGICGLYVHLSFLSSALHGLRQLEQRKQKKLDSR